MKTFRFKLESVLKIGQNVKFDWHVFARRGVEVTPLVAEPLQFGDIIAVDAGMFPQFAG